MRGAGQIRELGEIAEGKDARETQMILNHKAAIEMLVDLSGSGKVWREGPVQASGHIAGAQEALEGRAVFRDQAVGHDIRPRPSTP